MSISPRKTPGLPDGVGQASQLFFIIAAAILLVWAGLTSVYTVGAESEAVVLRLGRYIKTVKPGLHFKLPFGIDRRYKVAVLRQMKQEFGFATQGATNPYQSGGPAEQEEERSMVTGDLNAAQVEWVVQYRIKDPQQYLFHVRNPDETLRFASESAMREVVGDRTVDEVITIGRQEIENVALERLRSLVDRYEMGLYIDQVQLKNVNPPRSVQESFNEVNRAQQEKQRAINVASGELNKVVPKARGEADQKITAATGYAAKRVNEAQGDVAAFSALLEQYLKAPEVTKRRLYLETMSKVLPKVGKTIVVDAAVGSKALPLLDLGGNIQSKGDAQ